jgi:hypothetical protein
VRGERTALANGTVIVRGRRWLNLSAHKWLLQFE